MAQIKISQLVTGTPKGTDETPAVDTTDTTQAASGSTKKYIRSDELNFYLGAQGLTTYSAVLVATTANLTATYANGASGVGATLTNSGAQAALTIDGVLLVVGNRVLVKNQSTTYQNGIYTVTTVGTASTNWVLTRATDYNMPNQIIQYGVVLSDSGTANAGLLWQETGAGPFTIGTTAITFAAYTAQSLALPVLLSQGGTSAALTASNGGIFYTNATTGAILAGTATAGQVLQSGASSAPSWSTPTYPSASGTAGTILRSNGTNNIYTTSTFADTYAVSTLLYASSANAVSGLATANSAALVTNGSGVPAWQTMSAGQILIGTTAGAPTAAAINSGSGIVVANSSGSITVSATGGGIGWVSQASTPVTAAINTGYVVTDASTVTFTLPTTAALGSVVRIAGQGAGGWILAPGSGQTIKVLTASASTSVASTEAFDCIEVVCTVANLTWVTMSMVTTGFTIT